MALAIVVGVFAFRAPQVEAQNTLLDVAKIQAGAGASSASVITAAKNLAQKYSIAIPEWGISGTRDARTLTKSFFQNILSVLGLSSSRAQAQETVTVTFKTTDPNGVLLPDGKVTVYNHTTGTYDLLRAPSGSTFAAVDGSTLWQFSAFFAGLNFSADAGVAGTYTTIQEGYTLKYIAKDGPSSYTTALSSDGSTNVQVVFNPVPVTFETVDPQGNLITDGKVSVYSHLAGTYVVPPGSPSGSTFTAADGSTFWQFGASSAGLNFNADTGAGAQTKIQKGYTLKYIAKDGPGSYTTALSSDSSTRVQVVFDLITPTIIETTDLNGNQIAGTVGVYSHLAGTYVVPPGSPSGSTFTAADGSTFWQFGASSAGLNFNADTGAGAQTKIQKGFTVTYVATEGPSSYTLVPNSDGSTRVQIKFDVAPPCPDGTDSTNGLVGSWKGEGNPCDSSINNNYGKEIGNVTYNAAGLDGAAFSLDGASAIEVNHSNTLSLTNKFTFDFWMKPASLSDSQKYVFNKVAGADSAYGLLWEYTDDAVEFYAGSGSYTGENPRIGSAIQISDTDWHHVVYVYDGVTFKGFLDDQQVFSLTTSFTLLPSAEKLYLGAFNSTLDSSQARFFKGQLDEIRFYNTAVTPGPTVTGAVPGTVTTTTAEPDGTSTVTFTADAGNGDVNVAGLNTGDKVTFSGIDVTATVTAPASKLSLSYTPGTITGKDFRLTVTTGEFKVEGVVRNDLGDLANESATYKLDLKTGEIYAATGYRFFEASDPDLKVPSKGFETEETRYVFNEAKTILYQHKENPHNHIQAKEIYSDSGDYTKSKTEEDWDRITLTHTDEAAGITWQQDHCFETTKKAKSAKLDKATGLYELFAPKREYFRGDLSTILEVTEASQDYGSAVGCSFKQQDKSNGYDVRRVKIDAGAPVLEWLNKATAEVLARLEISGGAYLIEGKFLEENSVTGQQREMMFSNKKDGSINVTFGLITAAVAKHQGMYGIKDANGVAEVTEVGFVYPSGVLPPEADPRVRFFEKQLHTAQKEGLATALGTTLSGLKAEVTAALANTISDASDVTFTFTASAQPTPTPTPVPVFARVGSTDLFVRSTDKLAVEKQLVGKTDVKVQSYTKETLSSNEVKYTLPRVDKGNGDWIALKSTDLDADGISDFLNADQCPTVPGSPDLRGCPFAKEVSVIMHSIVKGGATTKAPVSGATVRVVEVKSTTPVADLYSNMASLFAGTFTSECRTGLNGIALCGIPSVPASSTTDWFTIAKIVTGGKTVYTGQSNFQSSPGEDKIINDNLQVSCVFDGSGNLLSCSGGKRTQVTGSLLDIYDPAVIIVSQATEYVPFVYETLDDYWSVVTSFTPPSGCTADVPEISNTVDATTNGNGTQAAVFTLTCDTSALAQAKSLLTAQVGAAVSQAAKVSHELNDCTKVNPAGKKTCVRKTASSVISVLKELGKATRAKVSTNSLWGMVAQKYNNGPTAIAAKVIEVAKANDIAIPEWGIAGKIDSRTLSASALNALNW